MPPRALAILAAMVGCSYALVVDPSLGEDRAGCGGAAGGALPCMSIAFAVSQQRTRSAVTIELAAGRHVMAPIALSHLAAFSITRLGQDPGGGRPLSAPRCDDPSRPVIVPDTQAQSVRLLRTHNVSAVHISGVLFQGVRAVRAPVVVFGGAAASVTDCCFRDVSVNGTAPPEEFARLPAVYSASIVAVNVAAVTLEAITIEGCRALGPAVVLSRFAPTGSPLPTAPSVRARLLATRNSSLAAVEVNAAAGGLAVASDYTLPVNAARIEAQDLHVSSTRITLRNDVDSVGQAVGGIVGIWGWFDRSTVALSGLRATSVAIRLPSCTALTNAALGVAVVVNTLTRTDISVDDVTVQSSSLVASASAVGATAGALFSLLAGAMTTPTVTVRQGRVAASTLDMNGDTTASQSTATAPVVLGAVAIVIRSAGLSPNVVVQDLDIANLVLRSTPLVSSFSALAVAMSVRSARAPTPSNGLTASRLRVRDSSSTSLCSPLARPSPDLPLASAGAVLFVGVNFVVYLKEPPTAWFTQVEDVVVERSSLTANCPGAKLVVAGGVAAAVNPDGWRLGLHTFRTTVRRLRVSGVEAVGVTTSQHHCPVASAVAMRLEVVLLDDQAPALELLDSVVSDSRATSPPQLLSGSGAVVVATPSATHGSVVLIRNCSFLRNNGSFSAGLSMLPQARTAASVATVEDSLFVGNFGGDEGGAMLVADGNVALVRRTVFVNNTATLAGGAVSSYGVSRLEACEFVGNRAAMGGALYSGRDAVASLERCTCLANRADVGGVVFTAGDEFTSVGCTYDDNDSEVGSILFASPDCRVHAARNAARLRANQVVLSAGVAAADELRLHNNSFACAVGSEFRSERLTDTYISRCSPCAPGTFAVAQSTSAHPNACLACGGSLGLDCSAGGSGVRVRPGYWLDLAQSRAGVVQAVACPDRYCCPPPAASCSPTSVCVGARAGRLCGRCADGFGEALGSTLCTPSASCSASMPWLLAASVALSLALFLACTRVPVAPLRPTGPASVDSASRALRDAGGAPTSTRSQLQASQPSVMPRSPTRSAVLKMLLAYFQCLPLLLARLERSGRAADAATLLAILNLRPGDLAAGASADGDQAQHRDHGVCVSAGMTAPEKAALSFTFPAAAALVAVAVACALTCGRRARCPRRLKRGSLLEAPAVDTDAPGPSSTLKVAKRAVYAGLVRMVLLSVSLSYGACVATAAQLLDCVDIGGVAYLHLDAEIECYTAWQYALMPASALLAAYPLAAALAARRLAAANPAALQPWQAAALDELGAPFRPGMQWWEGVMLARRVLLVAAHSFWAAPGLSWGALLSAVLCVAFLVSHLLARPYRATWAHVSEALLLGALSVVSLQAVGDSVFLSTGTPLPQSFAAAYTASQRVVAALVFGPFAAGCAFAVVHLAQRPTLSTRGLHYRARAWLRVLSRSCSRSPRS